jgi:hypothetical protein
LTLPKDHSTLESDSKDTEVDKIPEKEFKRMIFFEQGLPM